MNGSYGFMSIPVLEQALLVLLITCVLAIPLDGSKYTNHNIMKLPNVSYSKSREYRSAAVLAQSYYTNILLLYIKMSNER